MAHLGGLRLLATGIYMSIIPAQQDPHPLPPALIHSTPFVHSHRSGNVLAAQLRYSQGTHDYFTVGLEPT
jgi:hypothetical protein